MIEGIQTQPNMSTEMMQQMREKMFSDLDTDSDGQIDLSQLTSESSEIGVNKAPFAGLLEQLTAADTDGDGMVSREEFDAMELPSPPEGKPGEMPKGMETGIDLSQILDSAYTEDAEDVSSYMSGLLIDMLG